MYQPPPSTKPGSLVDGPKSGEVDLSVIIVNWNSAQFVRKCLESVCENTRRASLEIIVVDNASGGPATAHFTEVPQSFLSDLTSRWRGDSSFSTYESSTCWLDRIWLWPVFDAATIRFPRVGTLLS